MYEVLQALNRRPEFLQDATVLIEEWDGTLDIVRLHWLTSPENIGMVYEDGTRQVVSRAYLRSIARLVEHSPKTDEAYREHLIRLAREVC